MSQMTREAATEFFAKLFCGEHHIPSELKEWGMGWSVSAPPSGFATFDFNNLTRLVFLAHDRCVRAELAQSGPGRIRICIWQRDKREGQYHEKHPTIETALAQWRERESPLTQEVPHD